jgi:hypothetical protein
MRRAVVVAAILLLSGCRPQAAKRDETPGRSDSARTAVCDASALRADMGSGSPNFASCDVRTLVTLLGEDVRQAKLQCRAFVAFDADWKKRVENWDRLLASVLQKAPATGGQANTVADSATVVRNRAKPMLDSASLRNQRLNSLLDGVSTLEKAAGAPSPPIPDCQ